MYSISEVAKLTKLTARTLRHYEDKDLIKSSRRGQNGYRYYSSEIISRVEEIKKLKKMEFSLDEIKSFLSLKDDKLEDSLREQLTVKIVSLENEIKRLSESKNEVQDQLLATNNFLDGKVLEKDQRRVLMETIKSEVLNELKSKREVDATDLDYLKREDFLFDSKDKRDFFIAVGKCLKFAKNEGIKLGPARGAAPACLSLYALGWSDFDPTKYNLIPERYSSHNLDLHIDVEFKNGKKFIDYCKKVSVDLNVGNIEAFKLPILDIIDKVHERLGKVIDYDSIDDNDPIVLDIFRKGDIERIFSFDIPNNTLLAKHYDGYYSIPHDAAEKFKEYLTSQEIYDFVDLRNIEAIYRPSNDKPFMKEYIERYPKAKREGHYYQCLTSSLNEYLKPNFGVIIYQEDIIKIINEYTSWSYEKCNDFRVSIVKDQLTEKEKESFIDCANKEVFELLLKETPVTFCKAHAFGSWPKIIKKTAILKALHKDIYFEEIEKWEKDNGYSWGDFGFISGGVSLLQQ